MTHKRMRCRLVVALLVLAAVVPVLGQEEEGAETSLEAFHNLLSVLAGGTIFNELGRDALERTLIYQGLHPRQPASGIWERRDESGTITHTSGLMSDLKLELLDNRQGLYFFPSEPAQIPDQFLTHLLQTSTSTEYTGNTVTITLPSESTLAGDCSVTRSYSFRLIGGALFRMKTNLVCAP